MIPVRFVPDVREDLAGLPSEQLRRVALEWMVRLRRDPHEGKRLKWRHSGDLSTCRKLYFDEEDTPLRENFTYYRRPGGARYRIVYQLLPTGEHPEVIRVLAVGLGHDDAEPDAYDKAATRL